MERRDERSLDTLAEEIYYKLWPPITKKDLEAAYAMGMLKRDELEDGAQYRGYSRNATLARWNAAKARFEFVRTGQFPGDYFDDSVSHPSDDDGYDVFVPIEKTKT